MGTEDWELGNQAEKTLFPKAQSLFPAISTK